MASGPSVSVLGVLGSSLFSKSASVMSSSAALSAWYFADFRKLLGLTFDVVLLLVGRDGVG